MGRLRDPDALTDLLELAYPAEDAGKQKQRAANKKRRRVYPHPGREQETSAAYSGAGFRPNIRDQKKAKQRSPVEERPPDLTVTGRCFANMDHACRAQYGKGRQNLRRRGDTGEGLTSLSSFREFQSGKRGRACQGRPLLAIHPIPGL